MTSVWINFLGSLGAVALMLVLHAFLVMCETSLVKFRYGGVGPEVLERLKRRRGIGRLIDNSDKTGRTVRFSKTICTVAVGLLLMLVVSDFFRLFEINQIPNRLLVVSLLFVCAASLHFLFAEIFPRGLAMHDPVKGILCSYRVLLVFQVMTLPIMLFLRNLKRMFFSRIGLDLADELNPLDVDVQIRVMGEDTHTLSPVARKIMNHAFQMQDLVVQDVLLPRNEVIIYNLEEDLETNLEMMKEAGHTRYPLCRGNLDNCEGIIHIKDLFRMGDLREEIDLTRLKRTVATFELETPLEEALERMLRARFHMALVAGDFGEIVGVVTFESVLEELVGDIQDEFDREETQISALRTPNTFRISGSTPIHDIEETLGVEIERDEVSTFSGLIAGELGRIPEHGDTLTVSGMQILVDNVDGRRVIAARVLYEVKP
ncbi:MAG: CBS domain containing-hemolysin-like protein [Lentimonas sp.]|jgi:CBS domain containing-hemolysin-like protein